MTTKISGKQWAIIHLDWPLNSKMPRKEAVARFRLKTGHDCLATHLHKMKVKNPRKTVWISFHCLSLEWPKKWFGAKAILLIPLRP
jgi:hypothetical protein